MINLPLIGLFFSILLLSCNQQDSTQKEKNVIPFDKVAKEDFEIKDIEYIPLETTEHCLLGDISKVLYKDDRYYILDKNQNRGIYIFNKDGNFLSSINKQGEGPGEYIEITDMDVDDENNVYIADNAKMDIIKYIQANPNNYETIHVREHFMEFCYLNEHSFLLRDVFGPEGQKMKLASFNHKENSITSILNSKNENINEMDIMKCSKHYLYRSNEQIYYNERFTPYIYSISQNERPIEHYTISSEYYIADKELKGLEKNPVKFIQETTHIKDIISLYENDDYFLCMPFITPSATYLLIPKDNPKKAKKIDLMNKVEFQGTSQIEGVANKKFIVIMKYSESQAERLKDNSKLKSWNEESNPILILFSIK